VWNGIQKFRTPPFDILLVHDAARPFISPRIIEGIAQAALRNGAAVAAVRPTDTVKLSKDGDFVEETVDRQGLWLVQTPQGFRSDILVRSHEHARGQGFYGTDDSVLVERMGQKVRIVESDARNMKITTPLDMVIAEEIAGKYFRKEEGS
jgi:2-C-methyl-D-erythritol 4-phosphate cytidylyltransferase